MENAMTAPAVIRHLQFASLPNGTRLHYASAGERGKPLMLFVHGFPEFWFEWEAQLAEFGHTYFAVAPDLRGFNLSSKPEAVEAYRPRHIVEDLVQFVSALGYEHCVVVAHDWGGAICWNLAIQFPQLVEQLVIINSPHPYVFAKALATDPQQQAASAYMNWLRRPGSEEVLAANNFAMLESMLTASGEQPAPWFSGETREKYLAAWALPGEGASHSLSGGVNYYRASPMHPPGPGEPPPDISRLDPAAFVVRVPTLVIWGERDRALPKSLLDGLEQFVPDMRLERIPDGTHWVVHEQPELVNRLIRGALK
ncbi:Epoxide hydrolase A [Cupriavidus laharis]|uniref:Epoxide hydrolase A n=1 Tax=Cupriavidus laharis TaxID=151654 RepID=A0ABN7YLV0_9BURK|nr:alpha/beta hydrolase [Cupriavidus laharis]CAG9173171.1 Epoxide hydrolase A [Cupriavidus laharis]